MYEEYLLFLHLYIHLNQACVGEAGTRNNNNKKICTPDIPRCLYESCDSSKLCGVQIGTVEVEVLFYNDHIFLCLGQKVTN
jgi:hypothetical protein